MKNGTIWSRVKLTHWICWQTVCCRDGLKCQLWIDQRENLLLNERVIKCMFWELQVVQPQPLLPQILTYHCSKFNSSIHKQTTQRLRFSKRLIRRCDFAQPLSGLQRFIQVVFLLSFTSLDGNLLFLARKRCLMPRLLCFKYKTWIIHAEYHLAASVSGSSCMLTHCHTVTLSRTWI